MYENIFSTLVSCAGNGSVNLLSRNGSPLGTCQANGLSGTYKRISSLIKHSDPTTEIYGKQLSGSTSPNLPVDGERFLLYLDRTATPARIDYPNLFDIQIAVDDTDDTIEEKIRSVLSGVQTYLPAPTAFPAGHKWSQLIQPATPSVNLADVLLGNPEIRSALVSALRWKYLDIEMKYAEGLKMALSSHSINSKLIIPDKKNLYEISYLGGQGDARNFIFGFAPEENSDVPEWFTTLKNVHINDVRTFPPSLRDENNTGYTLSPDEIGILLGYRFP